MVACLRSRCIRNKVFEKHSFSLKTSNSPYILFDNEFSIILCDDDVMEMNEYFNAGRRLFLRNYYRSVKQQKFFNELSYSHFDL